MPLPYEKRTVIYIPRWLAVSNQTSSN